MRQKQQQKLWVYLLTTLFVTALLIGLGWVWAEPVTAQAYRCTVTPSRLNVRSLPKINAKIVGQMVRGTVFGVTARTAAADWLWGTGAGVQGWASGKYLLCMFDRYSLPVNSGLISTGTITLTVNLPMTPPTSALGATTPMPHGTPKPAAPPEAPPTDTPIAPPTGAHDEPTDAPIGPPADEPTDAP